MTVLVIGTFVPYSRKCMYKDVQNPGVGAFEALVVIALGASMSSVIGSKKSGVARVLEEPLR